MAIAQVQLRLPPDLWISRLHETHPHLHLEVVAFQAFENNSILSVVHLEGAGAGDLPGALREDPSVSSATVLFEAPREACISILTRNLPQAGAYLHSGVVAQTPFAISEGTARINFIGPKERIQSLIRAFDTMEMDPRLLSIRTTRQPAPPRPLTSHQERVVLYALRRGYYDVPRRADLKDLSRTLGLSRSGLSELLRRGERRLIEGYSETRGNGWGNKG
ncbi:MAG: helix-turn-helix domain-containing protein [Euryarchaeota archaeon]|nr:helix-turn-helix domain-containing protein [Euryarchaeota archaeon]